MKRIVVTGGAGFIGSHLVRALLHGGHEVTVLDDLSVGTRANVPATAAFVQCDVRDTEAIRPVLERAEAVYHLAARVSVRASVDRFVDDASVNVMGTLSVLEACRRSAVKRLVLASSMAVYADSEAGTRVDERHAAEPASPYGIGKLAAEHYVLNVAPQFGIAPVVLRFFNTYGPGQAFTPYVGVITIFIRKLAQGQVPTIFGDGTQTRDFVSVHDIVQANVAALERGRAGGIYNIGSGRGTSVLQLAQLIAARFGKAGGFEHAPAQPGEIRNSVADIAAAARDLGYAPRGSLGDDLGELVALAGTR
jgi:UDP-glucose 4-epimerase